MREAIFVLVGLCSIGVSFLVKPLPQKYWKYLRHPPRSEAELRWKSSYAKAVLVLVGSVFLLMGLALFLAPLVLPHR